MSAFFHMLAVLFAMAPAMIFGFIWEYTVDGFKIGREIAFKVQQRSVGAGKGS